MSICRAVHCNCVNNISPTGWNATVLFRNKAFHFCLWTCSHCKFAVTSKCHWNGNCSELCRSCYVYIILQCRTRWALCLDLSSSGKTNNCQVFFDILIHVAFGVISSCLKFQPNAQKPASTHSDFSFVPITWWVVRFKPPHVTVIRIHTNIDFHFILNHKYYLPNFIN